MPKKQNTSFFAIILIILIIGFMAFLIPAIFISYQGPSTTIEIQSEGESIQLGKGLEARLDNVYDNQKSINVTIIDSKHDTIKSKNNISVNSTISISNIHNMNITNRKKVSNSKSVVKYEYPVFHAWPNGAKFIVKRINLFILISLISMIIIIMLLAFSKGGIYD